MYNIGDMVLHKYTLCLVEIVDIKYKSRKNPIYVFMSPLDNMMEAEASELQPAKVIQDTPKTLIGKAYEDTYQSEYRRPWSARQPVTPTYIPDTPF